MRDIYRHRLVVRHQLTATNAQGSSSCTIPITRVTQVTTTIYVDSVNGDDLFSGRLPSAPYKTLEKARTARGASGTYKIYHRRGSVFTDRTLAIRPNTDHLGFGDPSLPPPHIDGVTAGTAYGIEPYQQSGSYQTNVSNVNLADLRVSGLQRCIYINGNGPITLLRIELYATSATEALQGAYIRNITGGLLVHHCTSRAGLVGDSWYFEKLGSSAGASVNKFRWNNCLAPGGKGADNIQVTSERNPTDICYDVEITDNYFENLPTYTSLKGNIIVEGVVRVLIARNYCKGRYFCISALSDNVTIRDNILTAANLDSDSFAVGCGALGDHYRNRWLLNLCTTSSTAMAISGYNDAASKWLRVDFELIYNTCRDNSGAYKQNRPTSGITKFNVSEGNSRPNFTPGTDGNTVAAGGVYATWDGTENFINPGYGPTVITPPTISGTVAKGSTLTVTVPTIAGCTSAVQWLVNGQIVPGATSTSFLVPADATTDPNMPNFMNTTNVTCVVLYTDGSGNETIAPAQFASGWTYALAA